MRIAFISDLHSCLKALDDVLLDCEKRGVDKIYCLGDVIDMGPEGGFRGGLVVAEGTPEEVAKVKASYTGQYLAEILATNRAATATEATATKTAPRKTAQKK